MPLLPTTTAPTTTVPARAEHRQVSKTMALALLIVGFTLIVTGCSSSPSTDELAQAREQGAKEAQDKAAQEAREQKLQDKIESLKEQSAEDKVAARKARRQAAAAERRANSNSGGGGGTTTGGGSGPVTACGGGVYAGANTSCSFAMNVSGEYGSNYGTSSLTAYSPATGLTYTMSCGTWSGGGHVCTGGNNASVYMP